jgi:hypothetical protein
LKKFKINDQNVKGMWMEGLKSVKLRAKLNVQLRVNLYKLETKDKNKKDDKLWDW